MVSIEVIALVLTGLSITASIVYYANVLSNANKTQKLQLETRKAQLYMQILDRFSSEENRLRSIEVLTMDVKDYEDYRENWSMYTNPEAAAKRFHVARAVQVEWDNISTQQTKNLHINNCGRAFAKVRAAICYTTI